MPGQVLSSPLKQRVSVLGSFLHEQPSSVFIMKMSNSIECERSRKRSPPQLLLFSCAKSKLILTPNPEEKKIFQRKGFWSEFHYKMDSLRNILSAVANIFRYNPPLFFSPPFPLLSFSSAPRHLVAPFRNEFFNLWHFGSCFRELADLRGWYGGGVWYRTTFSQVHQGLDYRPLSMNHVHFSSWRMVCTQNTFQSHEKILL